VNCPKFRLRKGCRYSPKQAFAVILFTLPLVPIGRGNNPRGHGSHASSVFFSLASSNFTD
jgi:hypothetical protein